MKMPAPKVSRRTFLTGMLAAVAVVNLAAPQKPAAELRATQPDVPAIAKRRKFPVGLL